MKPLAYIWLAACLLLGSLSAKAQIQTQQIRDDFHVLYGPGGNIGVYTGAEGIFLIDNKFAPLSEEIKQAISQFSTDSINFVINTHWHGDHTGGNENFAADGAVIVAHEMVYRRLSMDNFLPLYNSRTAPAPTGALPTVTFTEDIRFHSGNETIHVIHVPNAHTDTDSIVYFEEANLIQLGDLLWTDGYPRIDVQNGGGSVDGVIEALQRALALADDETQFISGHGPVPPQGQQVVRNYLMMLRTVRNRVVSMIAAGMNQQQIINADMFARILYISLAK